MNERVELLIVLWTCIYSLIADTLEVALEHQIWKAIRYQYSIVFLVVFELLLQYTARNTFHLYSEICSLPRLDLDVRPISNGWLFEFSWSPSSSSLLFVCASRFYVVAFGIFGRQFLRLAHLPIRCPEPSFWTEPRSCGGFRWSNETLTKTAGGLASFFGRCQPIGFFLWQSKTQYPVIGGPYRAIFQLFLHSQYWLTSFREAWGRQSHHFH